MKKGFTLIELMAVIIILGIVGLIVFPTAVSSINNSKKKLYIEQVNQILTASDNWATKNINSLPNEGETKILTVTDLKTAGLLKNESIKNPLDSSKEMSANIIIYYDSEYNQYISVYCDAEYGKNYYKDLTEYNNVKTICGIQ